MQWRQLRLALLVGLGSSLMAGCTSLPWTENGNPFGGQAADQSRGPSLDSQSPSSFGLSAAADSANSTTGVPSQKDRLEGEFALARLCERRGETEQAEQIYHSLLEKTPRDARLHHRLGVLAIQKGDFERAEASLNAAKSLAPPTAELLSDLGYCRYLQQKLPEAEQSLRDALKLDAACATALNNLALVVGKQGRYKESLELFQRANSEAEAYANLAYVMAQNGEAARAEQMYLRALTADNTLQAAAQAMLQVHDRANQQDKLASQTAVSGPDADAKAH